MTTAKWLILAGLLLEGLAIVMSVVRNLEEKHAAQDPPPAPVELEGISSGEAMVTGRPVLNRRAMADWESGMERVVDEMLEKQLLADLRRQAPLHVRRQST